MSKLSDLRVTVTCTYAVEADGTQGELLEQTPPRYSDAVDQVAFGSKDEALASLDQVSDSTPTESVEEAEEAPSVSDEASVNPE